MSSQDAIPAAPAASQRPRLKLKPRDPEAAARMEAERQASMGKSPFGNAKPREAVIAGRVGKSEEEVLKEEVNTQYKLHLRLSGPQLEEKKAQEARVQEIEEAAAQEEDPTKRDALEKEAAAQRLELEQMLEGFEKMMLEAALAGSAPRVSSIRRSHQDAAGEAQQAHQGAQQPGVGRYHPTQGYHMGRHQQQLDDGLPPSRGFPNGQYGKGYVPRSQGFPDYQQPRPQHRYQHQQHPEGEANSSSSSSFSKQGSRDYSRDDSDAGFYDTPSTFDPAAVAGRGSHGRGGYNRHEGGRANNNNGGYYQQGSNQRQYSQSGRGSNYSGSGGFGAPPSGRPVAGQGIGGEIKFDEDTFATGQDRF